jgi:hypothetical protein
MALLRRTGTQNATSAMPPHGLRCVRGTRAELARRVIDGHSINPRLPASKCMLPCTCRAECPSRIWKDMVMRFSSSLVVPSTIAALSTILLCAPAASQIPTGSAATIPPVTVDAPKRVARPHVSERGANTIAPRRTASTAQTSAARTPSYAPGSVMGRIASLEKVASSCNGGCASSFPSGKDPWVGCSLSGGNIDYGPFSPTCRDTITHKSYVDCVETRTFLGDNRNKAHWLCSSLAAGNRFKVADLKRSGRTR